MAFLQPQPSDPWTHQPVFRAPPVVISLIAILVAAHGARAMVPPNVSTELINQFGLTEAAGRLAQQALDLGADVGSVDQMTVDEALESVA